MPDMFTFYELHGWDRHIRLLPKNWARQIAIGKTGYWTPVLKLITMNSHHKTS